MGWRRPLPFFVLVGRRRKRGGRTDRPTAVDCDIMVTVLVEDVRSRPDSPEARRSVAMVRENCRWEHAGQPFFDGEVEPCINGLTAAIGAYFGEDVSDIVDCLLGEQMDDGGWNCEQENGSTRGSFHTTIAVLGGCWSMSKGLVLHRR